MTKPDLISAAKIIFVCTILAFYLGPIFFSPEPPQQLVCADSTVTSSVTMKLTVAVQECGQ